MQTDVIVMNKVITRNEQCKIYNFLAPLGSHHEHFSRKTLKLKLDKISTVEKKNNRGSGSQCSP